mgnify:CR=1 FL=1
MPAYNAADLLGGSSGPTFNIKDLGSIGRAVKPVVSERSLNLIGGTPIGPVVRFATDVISNQFRGKPQDLLESATRSAHPLLFITGAVVDKFGGPKLTDAFREGIVTEYPDGNYDINLPPMSF